MRTLLYDGECGFCRWVLGGILRWDRLGRIRPVALQDALAADLLPGMSEEDRFASFHLVEDGEIVSGGRALPPLVAELPRGGRIAAALGALQPLTDLGYRGVSANRARLGPLIPDTWKDRADQRIRSRQAQLADDPVEGAARDLSRA